MGVVRDAWLNGIGQTGDSGERGQRWGTTLTRWFPRHPPLFITMSDYFDAIKNAGALQQRRPVPLCKRDAKLPPGSSWTAKELATFRVVVKAAILDFTRFSKRRPRLAPISCRTLR